MRFFGQIKSGQVTIFKIFCDCCDKLAEPAEFSDRIYCSNCEKIFQKAVSPVITERQVH